MNPLIALKRQTSADLSICIFCQTEGGLLRSSTKQGIERVLEVTEIRRKLRDHVNRVTIDRILQIVQGNDDLPSLVWHKSCYAQYTDKNKIKRLETFSHDQPSPSSSCSSSQQPSAISSRRSNITPTKWDFCIFCQETRKERLSSIMTLNASQATLEESKLDPVLSIRLAGVTDLIAEGKYHLSCRSSFKRSSEKIKLEAQT